MRWFDVVQLLIAAAVIATGFRRPRDRVLALFSATYAVPVTTETRSLVEEYVGGSRRFRLTGLTMGIAYAVVDEVRTGTGSDEVYAVALGYGLGAVAYELLRPTPVGGMASLDRRHLRDYVSPGLAWLAVGAVLVAVSLFAVALRLGEAPNQTTDRSESWYLAVGAIVLVAIGVAFATARRIVASPQPLVSTGVDAAQHAIRSSGLITLMGLVLLGCGWFGGASVTLVNQAGITGRGWFQFLGGVTVMFAGGPGLFLTFRSLPRFAPFWRDLPDVEPAGAVS